MKIIVSSVTFFLTDKNSLEIISKHNLKLQVSDFEEGGFMAYAVGLIVVDGDDEIEKAISTLADDIHSSDLNEELKELSEFLYKHWSFAHN